MTESVFHENAIVPREFIQLSTRASGNGGCVQHSIRTIKMIGNMIRNLKLRFFRISVVAEKQFVLKILITFLWNFLFRNVNSMLHIIFPPVTCLPLPYLSHYVKYGTFQKRLNRECASRFLKHFLL